MRTRPADLSDAAVLAAVAGAWGLPVTSVVHAPWGFGSHHWVAELPDGTRRFVTVDAVPGAVARQRLSAAMATAVRLSEAGLVEVVAPLPGSDGRPLQRLTGQEQAYAVALFPWLDAASPVGPDDRGEVLDLLARLHAATPAAIGAVEVDDLVVEGRVGLERALGSRESDWGSGPLAAEAASLVAGARVGLGELLVGHDAGVAALLADRQSWVVTHGEPKPGNLLRVGGALRLVDWDTVRLAPAGRDLWMVDPAADRHATWWAARWVLSDVAAYVADFRGPHEDDADSRVGLGALRDLCGALAEGRVPWPGLGW